MGSFLKPSSDDCDQDYHHNSISFLSILESYPLSYIVDEEMLDETYSFDDIVNKDHQEVISSIVHLELEGATGVHEEFIPSVVHLELIEGATWSYDQEFIPSVVRLELIESATGSHEDCKDLVPCFDQVDVIEGSIGSDEEIKEFDGYEGDVDSIEEEDDDDNLKIRVEEFIAKNIRKWKEEMLNDKLLCLEF
ncbi:hypothetical protein L6452_33482 [Arctium lappa]|uniref:Uncharacterized protein n=1 Tax=Arctium lappa TaxID=4217 RepID=A0ACB8YFL3_ARCLA|nr:hypothetical protein L6452_33482 [Arctium lappa]